MAKHGGGFGGMNMNELMKQAQRMQRKMEEQQAEMEKKEFTGTAGGNAVSIVMNGKKELLSVKISKEVVDPDDVEMLEDLITAAFNDVNAKVDEANAATMQGLAGGMGGFM